MSYETHAHVHIPSARVWEKYVGVSFEGEELVCFNDQDESFQSPYKDILEIVALLQSFTEEQLNVTADDDCMV